MPAPTPSANPERIFNTLNAYQQSEALKAAIELDLFTAIGEGATDPVALASRAGAAERGVRILCDFLTIHGLLKKANGHYALSEESALFLDRRSPACLASMASFLGDACHIDFAHLPDAVRRGGAVTATGDNTKPNDELWVSFARTMAPLAAASAPFIASLTGAREAKPCKVLDIAAGHGMFGITIAQQNSNAAIVALDWAPVLEVAKENAAKAGVTARYQTRAGSAFEIDLGKDYDFVLLTNIFHHFDMPTCEKLMRRVHAALKPAGKAITLEFVPNEDRITPPTAAAFSMIMLVNTDHGDAYTFAEYEKMFRNSGFPRTALHQVPSLPQQILVSDKPA